MGKSVHLDRDHEVILVDTHLRVGKVILVGFIAIFPAILAKVKHSAGMVRKLIGTYDQKVFWPGSVACFIIAILTVAVLVKEHWKSPDLGTLVFLNCFIFFLFYDFLQIAKKDEHGRSHWL